jgi:hypothetical protein
MIQKITNHNIYSLVDSYTNAFAEFKSYIPAKANFAMQKNISTLTTLGEEIEKARLNIAKHYGEPDEENNRYTIPEENRDVVAKELEELLSIEQEVEIKMIKVEDLGNAEFTTAQMQAIMFMIEE